MWYYKLDCGNNQVPVDIPEDVTGIEIDQKSLNPDYEIYLEKNQNEFTRINLEIRGDSSNNYGKKYIKGYTHNQNLEDEIQTVITVDTRKFNWESPNLEAILLLKENYTYRDTWFSRGDSWCLYILSGNTVINEATRKKSGGAAFIVTPHPYIGINYYAPLLLIASSYIKKNFVWNWLARAVAAAHEIGHVFQTIRYECVNSSCIMYEELEDPPAYQFCFGCRGMFCEYYLPKRLW